MGVVEKLFLFCCVALVLQVGAILCREDDLSLSGNKAFARWRWRPRQSLLSVERVARMVEASEARARATKNRGRLHGKWNSTWNRTWTWSPSKSKHNINIDRQGDESIGGLEERVYGRSFGGYSMRMQIGSPPQEVSVIMDTGSDLVWVPCTAMYTCLRCPDTPNSKRVGATGLYLPRDSSSKTVVTCADPKCKNLHGDSTERLCFHKGKCRGSLKNCSNVACPVYVVEYGRGTTLGLLLSETFTFPTINPSPHTHTHTKIKHVAVGCSLISLQIPRLVGIAGFGRGTLSLPSQIAFARNRDGGGSSDQFAYCLPSHRFDDEEKTSSTLLLGKEAIPRGIHLNYTPFIINRNARGKGTNRTNPSPYEVYYYVGLRAVSVGGKRLKLSSKLVRFDREGNGGSIIDSGTTFTVVHEKIFQQIAAAFGSRIKYKRATAVEAGTGLGLCYNVSGLDDILLPRFAFHFKGGADMELPLENYFVGVAPDTLCMTMLSSSSISDANIGPAVLLGNYNQQNFYVLYDREKNRLGFAPKTCTPPT